MEYALRNLYPHSFNIQEIYVIKGLLRIINKLEKHFELFHTSNVKGDKLLVFIVLFHLLNVIGKMIYNSLSIFIIPFIQTIFCQKNWILRITIYPKQKFLLFRQKISCYLNKRKYISGDIWYRILSCTNNNVSIKISNRKTLFGMIKLPITPDNWHILTSAKWKLIGHD